jgi:nucleotide-binding universal stress UspA family protein
VQVYPSVGFEAAPQVFEGNRTFFKDNAERVKKQFEEAMSREGLAHDFHQIDARTPVIADELIAQGRSADVIVVSATNPEEITGVERDFIEQVVMSAGRPVIVLPFDGIKTIALNEIVLGWDGGREAARAAFDALPLLKLAGRVRVVRVDPQKDPTLRGSVPGADLAEALARHGVKAEAQGFPTDGQDEGQALMRCAEDCGAGLVVMGAYGHSRLAEFIFGGATRFVLTRMNRPVLLSH